MAFGTARNDAQTAFDQFFRHRCGIDFHLFRVLFELGLQGFFERNGFGGNDVHQRTALQAWEDGRVQRFFMRVVAAQNHAAARTAQGFVGGGGDEVAERDGVGIFAAGNQACVVRHIDKEVGTDFVGDFAEFRPVDLQCVGRCAGNDHFGFVFEREAFDFGVIEDFVFIQAVGNGVVEFAGNVDAGTVGQVSAVGEAHAEDGVAGFEDGGVHGLIGLGAGMGLDVGVFCTEEFFDAVDCQLFDDIDVFAAAVVAFAGVAFGVFVGQLRTLCLHHGATDVVFGSNQFDVVLLALVFLGNGGCQLRIILG